MTKNIKIHRLRLWSVLSLCFIFSIYNANAQYEDDYNDTDSTENDSYDDWGDYDDFDSEDDAIDDKGTPPKPLAKYERIDFIPVDTLTKLITYTAVHDVENDCEYCTSDSLYYRIKKYLIEKYGDGKKLPKSWVIEDIQNQKIIMTVRIPLITQPNEFSKVQDGEYEFKFQLWVRDYAYKYKFTSIVHYDPVINGKPGKYTPVYLEYYLKNKTKVKYTDLLLKAVDRDMKELIEGIINISKDPVTLDIDEEDF